MISSLTNHSLIHNGYRRASSPSFNRLFFFLNLDISPFRYDTSLFEFPNGFFTDIFNDWNSRFNFGTLTVCWWSNTFCNLAYASLHFTVIPPICLQEANAHHFLKPFPSWSVIIWKGRLEYERIPVWKSWTKVLHAWS